MKRIILAIAAFSLAIPFARAQKNEVTSAWMYLRHRQLDKAKTAIDAASNFEGTKDDAKTWMYRGDVYSAIAQSSNAQYKSLSNDAASEAIQSWSKVMATDAKNNFPQVFDSLQNMAIRSFNNGIKYYKGKNYDPAIKEFSHFFEAYNGMGNQKSKLDATLGENHLSANKIKRLMAETALDANKTQLAEKLLKELADAHYDDEGIYTALSKIYMQQKDTQKALAVLDNGIANLKDNKSLIEEELDTYIKMGKSDKAIALSNKAIAADPNNTSIYVAMGNIYDYDLKNYDKAQEYYLKALAIDSTDASAASHLGFSYFNQGADVYNLSINETNIDKSNKLIEEAKDYWKKALPLLLKANRLKPGQNDVLDVLAKIYAQLGDNASSKAYRAMIKQ